MYTTGTPLAICVPMLAYVAANRCRGRSFLPSNRCLGQAVDAAGNLYCAETGLRRRGQDHAGRGGLVPTPPARRAVRFSAPTTRRSTGAAPCTCPTAATGPAPSTAGSTEIEPGGGAARLWYPGAIDTPNAIALDAAERYLYLVETFGAGIARVAIDVTTVPPALLRARAAHAAARAGRHRLRRAMAGCGSRATARTPSTCSI